jgi:protein-tyrosine phosphatase
MIDIHNHLLPGIDDGAADMDAALQMARLAVTDGITHLLCTPHIHPRLYDNTAASITTALQGFRLALREAGIPLAVGGGAEVRFGLEIMQSVADGSLPFVGRWQGRRVLLLELPHNELPFGTERLTAWLLSRGVVPMIAHPERNRGLQKAPDRVLPLLAQGCLLQVTAGSVTGHFGTGAKILAHQLLEEGAVTVLASDAHNVAYRPPGLSAAAALAAELVGEGAARALVHDNPWQLTQHHFASGVADAA